MRYLIRKEFQHFSTLIESAFQNSEWAIKILKKERIIFICLLVKKTNCLSILSFQQIKKYIQTAAGSLPGHKLKPIYLIAFLKIICKSKIDS